MTATEVTAKKATWFHRAGIVRMNERVAHSQIEFVGVPVRGLIRAHSGEPGRALSRENAYDMREFAVTEAMPQKNWATPQMTTSASPPRSPRASRKICAGGSPLASAALRAVLFFKDTATTE